MINVLIIVASLFFFHVSKKGFAQSKFRNTFIIFCVALSLFLVPILAVAPCEKWLGILICFFFVYIPIMSLVFSAVALTWSTIKKEDKEFEDKARWDKYKSRFTIRNYKQPKTK